MDEKRIFLLDAEGPLRRALAEQLAASGYAIDASASPNEAQAACQRHDLLLVAGLPPDSDAVGLYDAWCGAGAAVLVLAEDGAMGAAAEEAGAISLAKPVRLAELIRAVKDALRPTPGPDLGIGTLRFHPPTRELSAAAAASVRLTEKEAAILACLHRAGPAVVPRDALLSQIWGYASAIATHTLETHVYRLRRKLAAVAPDAPRLVSDGNGYRLATPEEASDPASANTAR